ncbi:MAG: nuclear transport factor 2 family protein [Paracoccaceae bacterium]
MDTETVIRTVIAAYAASDIDTVLESCTDDIHYCVQSTPECGPYFADCRGKAAFVDALNKYVEDWNFGAFELIDIIVSGNRAATRQRVDFINRGTGAQLQTRNALFWMVEGDKIAEILEFQDTATIAAARG